VFLRQGQHLGDLPIVEVYVARESARRGDRDDAIPLIRTAVDHLVREGQLLAGDPVTGVLVEILLDRGAENDVAEAIRQVIDYRDRYRAGDIAWLRGAHGDGQGDDMTAAGHLNL
jgi:hypothetical protein